MPDTRSFHSTLRMAGMLTASFITFAMLGEEARADGTCPTDTSLLSKSIQSADLDNRFGPTPLPTKPVRAVYVTQLLEDPFWKEVLIGLRDEAKRLNVTLDATAPANRTSESEQLQVAEAALATNPDILILTGINGTNLRSVIDKANQKRIPTISINLKSEGIRVHIGTNPEGLGAAGAEFLHEHFPGGAAVAQLEGEKTSPYRINRVKGFTERLKDYPNLTLVASVQADWDDRKGYEQTLKMMKEYPQIKGIYANSDLMALGAVKALGEIGRLNDVVVIGTDGVLPAKKAMIEGTLEGSAAQFPVKEGILGLQIGLRLLNCQPIPGWVVSPQAVMTQKSVGDYMQTQ